MSNEIINQNADEQEVAQAPAATTKSPVDNTMEDKPTNDLKPTENDVSRTMLSCRNAEGQMKKPGSLLPQDRNQSSEESHEN